MKRNITAIFLVIAIMFGNMFIFPVSAAGSTPTIEIETRKGVVGETVEIPVNIKDNDGITAFELDITYGVGLEFIGSSIKGVGSKFDIASVGEKDEAQNTLKAIGMSYEISKGGKGEVSDDGELFTLSFKVKGNTNVGVMLAAGTIEKDFDDTATTQITGSNGGVEIVDYYVKVGDEEGAAGGQVTVPVTMVGTSTSIAGFEFEVEFDPTVLEFVEVKDIEDVDVGAGFASGTSIVTVVGGYAEPTQGAKEKPISGLLCNIIFKVKAEAVVGTTTDLEMKSARGIKAIGDDEINFEYENGSVTVVADSGETGDIDIKDEAENNDYWWKDGPNDVRFLIVPYDAKIGPTLDNLICDSAYVIEIYNNKTNTVASTATDLIATGMTFQLKPKAGGASIDVENIVVVKYGDVEGTGEATTAGALQVLRKAVQKDAYNFALATNDILKSAVNEAASVEKNYSEATTAGALQVLRKAVQKDAYNFPMLPTK